MYRLPTEAEWEYACRAGTTTPFSTGRSLSASFANFNSPGSGGTCRAGEYPASPWKLYDLHGNVWEWCADWYDPRYYENSPREDPPGPPAGTERVLRGGSWSCAARYCRSAHRGHGAPGNRQNDIGFRVVMVPGGTA
jgi:formylglycine-generating enzyme required for sulfatase activity